VSSLGAKLGYERDTWIVESRGILTSPAGSIDCGESGVTLRFTIPISSLVGSYIELKGNENLMRRPLRPLVETMRQLGVEIDVLESEVRVKAGGTRGGTVQLPGNVSSQFISGLILAGPLMEQGLNITLTSPLQSRGYVSLTIETLSRHGIIVQTDRNMLTFHVAPHQNYQPAEHTISGDYSSAAFLMSAAAITGSHIRLKGLSHEDTDPDSVFLNILTQMGATPRFSGDVLTVEGQALKAMKVNISDCPDLGPVIAVLGSHTDGETEITGAERLRFKESDRLKAIASELKRLGAKVGETENGLLVSGPSPLHGGTVDSHGDHRIAMSLAVAALNASDSVTIRNANCVNKSYPTFFDDIRSLGVEVIER
jgi:3-phosphoshikimate 1-carboxyvinyltransferase